MLTGKLRRRTASHPLLGAAVIVTTMTVFATGCQHRAKRLFEPLHHSIARRDVKRGEQMLARADEHGAVEAFESAIARDPKNVVAHAHLGHIHALAGDFSRASTHYRAAVKLAPENRDYALALADSLRHQATTSMDRLRILEAAVRAYSHARRLDPDHFDAALGLAQSYRQLGKLDLAINALRDAGRIDPTAAIVHTELASIYRARSMHGRALSEYRKALKLDPDNLAAHNASGELNAALSRRKETRRPLARERALAHFRKSLQLNPDQPRVRALLADLQPHTASVATLIEDQDD